MTQHEQTEPQESFNIVIVGHVDHGKSTLCRPTLCRYWLIAGRQVGKGPGYLSPAGQGVRVRVSVRRIFEEQEQGITIDTARTFFIWNGRQYIII